MPIPDDFDQQTMYAPEAWFITDVTELDAERLRTTAVVDTTRLGPLCEAQVPWPGHEPHLPAGISIQITGILASLLGAYCMDMRATDGWIGYGTHIHEARFPSMGRIGPPVLASAEVVKKRVWRGTVFVRYRFEYTQEDRVVYEAEHSAAWRQTDHRGPPVGAA